MNMISLDNSSHGCQPTLTRTLVSYLSIVVTVLVYVNVVLISTYNLYQV